MRTMRVKELRNITQVSLYRRGHPDAKSWRTKQCYWIDQAVMPGSETACLKACPWEEKFWIIVTIGSKRSGWRIKKKKTERLELVDFENLSQALWRAPGPE